MDIGVYGGNGGLSGRGPIVVELGGTVGGHRAYGGIFAAGARRTFGTQADGTGRVCSPS